MITKTVLIIIMSFFFFGLAFSSVTTTLYDHPTDYTTKLSSTCYDFLGGNCDGSESFSTISDTIISKLPWSHFTVNAFSINYSIAPPKHNLTKYINISYDLETGFTGGDSYSISLIDPNDLTQPFKAINIYFKSDNTLSVYAVSNFNEQLLLSNVFFDYGKRHFTFLYYPENLYLYVDSTQVFNLSLVNNGNYLYDTGYSIFEVITQLNFNDFMFDLTNLKITYITPDLITNVYGCMDSQATNYNPLATIDDGSCTYAVHGCTHANALNYNPLATIDDGTCISKVYGCIDSNAINYNPQANIDDDSCEYSTFGCTNKRANNYDAQALHDDGSCVFPSISVTQLGDGETILKGMGSDFGSFYAILGYWSQPLMAIGLIVGILAVGTVVVLVGRMLSK